MSFNSSLSGSSKPLEGLMSQQDDKTEKITIQNEATRQMEGARGGPAGNLPNEATKTPSKKMRKKKHRPKVVKEDKPAANERGKSKILETPTNKETSSSGKRKYVRKSKAQTPCGNLSNESMPKVDPAPVTGISMCVASETPNTKEITPPGKKKYVQKKKAQDHSENTSASGGIADPTPSTGILASEVSATPDNIENTASGKRKRVQKMKHVNLLGSSTSTPVVVVDSTPVRGTLKSASTKTPSIKEITPPGKRKYVRKRKAQNTLDLSSDAQIASSLENKGAYCGDATKRVRRCLSYDVEYSQSTYEQGQEYQVNDPPSSNTGSSFVKSNMQNSPGLEPGSSKEIKYDLNIQMHPATGEVRHFGAEPHQHFRTETMEANNMQDWQRQILGHSEKQASKSYSTDVATNFQCQESGGTQSDFSEVLNLLASTKQSHTGEHDALSSMHDGTMIYNEHYLPYSTRGHEKKKTEPDNNRLTYKSASPSKIMQSDAWTKNQEHHISLHTTEAFAISSLGAPKVQQSIQHMPFGQAEKVLNTLSEIPAELTSPSANRTMKQNKLSVLVKPFPDNSSQQQMSKLQNFAESKVQDNKGKGIIRKCKEEHKHHTSKDIASSSISIGCSGRKALHSSVSYNSSNLTETNSVCSYSGEPVWYSDPIDEITRRLRFLTINEASENASAQMQNAIVPYKSITEPKRKWQPRVDLDPESNKVWNLLMGKESSDNAEGTDSKKEKWWHEERRIFRGRVDSFIARMHLVQGDRRFSKWKGSVVDSVVGVFLTQNVSDHLSSSAFMALAAKFPVESRKSMNLNSEDLGVESRESCATDNKNTTKVQEHVANQHYSARTYLANMEREDSGSFKMEAGISRFGGLCANEARAVVDNCSPDSGSSTPITPRGTSGAQMENVLPPSTSSLDILGIAEGVEATSYGEIDRFSHAEVGTRSFFQDPLGLFSCKNMCSAGTGIHDARCAEPSAAPSVLNTKHLSSRQAEDYLANQTLHCANNPKKLPEASKAAVTGQCSHSQGHSSVKVQETIDTEPQIKNIQPDHLSNQQKLQKLSVKRGNIPSHCLNDKQCFAGFICVRGFDRETRAPKPLYARLHVPASKTPKTKDS